MKKSIMSVTMLVVSISMVVMLLCGSVANAQTTSNFVYDKKENVEVVYTLDETGRYLTPKLKYEFVKTEDGQIATKNAFRWNASNESWMPYYQMNFIQDGNNAIIEFAAWNVKTADFSLKPQKAVYNLGTDNDVVTYLSYNWNPETSDWNLNNQVIYQNYLAGY